MTCRALIPAIVAMVLASGLPVRAQSVSELLEKGIFTEETVGDLDAAIKIYEQIVAEAAKNRSYAAQAQYRLGMCYLKKGKKDDAVAAFRMLIDRFPKQRQMIVHARARLTDLGQRGPGPILRHVWDVFTLSNIYAGSLSPDGRYVSYVDWRAGNLAVRDLASGTSRLVTKNVEWASTGGWNEESIISPHSKQIAYHWFDEKGDDFYDLRVIDMDGSNMRILHHDAEVPWVRPFDWSPDGKELLVHFGRKDKVQQLGLVSVSDGSFRIIKSWNGRRWPQMASFSPDGGYVAFDLGPEGDLAPKDIFVIDIERGLETPIIEHPSRDELVGWTPDGKRILFISDRTSKRALWMIDVNGGKPGQSPVLLKTEFEGRPTGITPDGALYSVIVTTANNVHLARLDTKGVRIVGQPQIASTRFVDSASISDWSPDGKYLAYRVGPRSDPFGRGPWRFVIQTVRTGEERVLTPSPGFSSSLMRGPRWSPDGRSLLVTATGIDTGQGLYAIDVKTGETKLIAKREGAGFPHANLRNPAWSPDGKAVYFWRESEAVIKRDLTTGKETELYRGRSGSEGLDVSPDGRWLAFFRPLDSLIVIPTAGGEPREVCRLSETESNESPWNFVRWTPDGKHLLFRKRVKELWRVQVDTGEQQQIDSPAMDRIINVALHPNGRRIAYTVGKRSSEFWVMENFLPEKMASLSINTKKGKEE